MTLTQENITEIVTKAFIYVSQDITQGILATQEVRLDCTNEIATNACQSCTNDLVTYYKDRGYTFKQYEAKVKETCGSICDCTIKNVDMKMFITVNWQNFLKSEAELEFKNSVETMLKAKQKISGFVNAKQIQKNLSQLYQTMRTNITQSSFQEINAKQSIKLTGPGQLIGASMEQMITSVSKIISSNKQVSKVISKIKTDMSTDQEVKGCGLVCLIINIAFGLVILVLIILLIKKMKSKAARKMIENSTN